MYGLNKLIEIKLKLFRTNTPRSPGFRFQISNICLLLQFLTIVQTEVLKPQKNEPEQTLKDIT